MKFVCLDCDEVMAFSERQLPGDGTLAAVFRCSSCGRETAMLTNPMETQLVTSLGVKIGGRAVPEQPLESTRTGLAEPRESAFSESPGDSAVQAGGNALAGDLPPAPSARPQAAVPARVTWSDDAVERLAKVPSFVRGMVKRIYADYAMQHSISEITPEVMSKARSDLGLEGM